jgi:transcription elongation factor GreA
VEASLKRLLQVVRPRAIEEVKRLAMMGDFSENAGYQMAKGKLRGINQRIIDFENMIKYAEIIDTGGDKTFVRLGDTVTVEKNGKQQSFLILGSAETNPQTGVISHNSPLGSLLLDKRAGDIVKMNLADKIVEYKIIRIE